jgi:hypothetical protein
LVTSTEKIKKNSAKTKTSGTDENITENESNQEKEDGGRDKSKNWYAIMYFVNNGQESNKLARVWGTLRVNYQANSLRFISAWHYLVL